MKKTFTRALIPLLGLLLTGAAVEADSSPVDAMRHAREEVVGRKSALKAESKLAGRDMKEAKASQAEKAAAARRGVEQGGSTMRRNRRARIEEMGSRLQAERQELTGTKREMGTAGKKIKEGAQRMRRQNEEDRQRLRKMRDEAGKYGRRPVERAPE